MSIENLLFWVAVAGLAIVGLIYWLKLQKAKQTSEQKLALLTPEEWELYENVVLGSIYDLLHRQMSRYATPNQIHQQVALVSREPDVDPSSRKALSEMTINDLGLVISNLVANGFCRYGSDKDITRSDQVFLVHRGRTRVEGFLTEPAETTPASVQVSIETMMGGQVSVASPGSSQVQQGSFQTQSDQRTALLLDRIDKAVADGSVDIDDPDEAHELIAHLRRTITLPEEDPERKSGLSIGLRALLRVLKASAATALTNELTAELGRLINFGRQS